MDGLSEQALDNIDPERVWPSYAELGQTLLAKFRTHRPLCNGYEAARRAVITVWLEARRAFGDEFPAKQYPFKEMWSVCDRTLNRAWGCVEDMLKAISRGSAAEFDHAVDELILTMAQHYAEDDLRSRVSAWSYGLSVEEQLAAPLVYLRRFAKFFPDVLTRGRMGTFELGFRQIHEWHPKLVRRFTFDVVTRVREHGFRLSHGQE